MRNMKVDTVCPGPTGSGTLLLTGGRLFRNAAIAVDVFLGESCEGVPGHDRRELAPVRPHAGLQRGDDLFRAPVAEAGLVGRQIGADEDAEPGNFKSDIRAAKKARHVRLAEKVSRGVAVVAPGDRDEIFAARDLGVVGSRRQGLKR